MKKISIFFFSFFIALIITFIAFAVIVNFCGRGLTDQPWFSELYPLKNHMAKTKKSPKIVLIGGSSSLFGIDGKKLHEYTGMDNINFSMSIMMPMRFYLADLEKNVGNGDIIVLPLEAFHHYTETEEKNFSQFGISLLFGCMPETQKLLSFSELCSLYFQYGFSWINTSLFHENGTLRRCFRKDFDKQGVFDGFYKESYVYKKWAELQTEDKKGTYGYFSDLSVYGDWLVDTEEKTGNYSSPPYPTVLSQEFLDDYSRIRDLANKRHAKLMLVWTNLYFYSDTPAISEFKELLKSHDIVIYGRPEASSFPKEFYYEPIFHMNRRGAELWTYELAKTICKETGRPLKKINDWPYVVFADNPLEYFPDAEPTLYDTGVEIRKEKFRMILNVPKELRGKPLKLSLIAKNNSGKERIFTSIQANGKDLDFREHTHTARTEIVICVPFECSNQEKLDLQCQTNDQKIGMERIFIQKGILPVF